MELIRFLKKNGKKTSLIKILIKKRFEKEKENIKE